MPTISGVGKRRPTSTTTIRPSYSTTVMFLPISPSPPSGQDAQRAAHACVALRSADGSWRSSIARTTRVRSLVGLDQRQAQAADAQAEQLQRGLRAVGLAVMNSVS